MSASQDIIIGRAASCAYCLTSSHASQQHASLSPKGDGSYILNDLGSSNGTFVNSPTNKVQSAVVHPHDVVYFADEKIQVSAIINKQGVTRRVPTGKKIRLGRAQDNDVVVEGNSVSRYHAELLQEGDGSWWVKDCDSSNGTFVDGKKVTLAQVTPSSSITLGQSPVPSGLFSASAPARPASPIRSVGSQRSVASKTGSTKGKIAGVIVAVAVLVMGVYFAPTLLNKAGLLPEQAPQQATQELPQQAAQQVPQQAPQQTTQEATTTLSRAALAELMEQATVLIITDKGLGSGFFIAPNIVLTNSHVVKDAKEYDVLGTFPEKAVSATLVAMTTPSKTGDRDYAILEVPLNSKYYLCFNTEPYRTQKISAWGFPGIVLSGDTSFSRNKVPEVAYAEGVISVIHDGSPAYIIHTAMISQGNSGGPLVNENGEVLGINTWTKTRENSNHQLNNAIVSDDILAFLRGYHIPFILATDASK